MMRNLLIALAAFSALGTAGSAGAVTLAYSGTLTLRVANLPTVSLTGSGIYVGPTHISEIAFSPGQFGPITVSLPVTSSYTIQSLWISGLQNLAGTMTGISGGPPLGAGTMGLSGIAKICFIFAPACGAAVTLPLTPIANTGMGIGGVQFLPGNVPMTMYHAPWTLGQPTMTIHTPGTTISVPTLPGGFASPPSSTAQPSGILQMVTATKAYSYWGKFLSMENCKEYWGGVCPEFPLSAALQLTFLPACSNGLDDDGDGLIDHRADPGCADDSDPSERDPSLVCDNGEDDDGDGRIDFDPVTFDNPGDEVTPPAGSGDPGCKNPTWSTESPQCQDGVNNDRGQDPNPGLIDFDGGQSIWGECTGGPGGCPPEVSDPEGDGVANPDPQCVGKPWKNAERRPRGCGLGADLALLLPPLMWLHRRRIRRV